MIYMKWGLGVNMISSPVLLPAAGKCRILYILGTKRRSKMNAIETLINGSRKIVIKIGSNVLSNDEGAVN